MNNSSSMNSETNIEKPNSSRTQPIREAKSKGNITRQLTSYIDNASSSSIDNPSSSSIEMNDNSHQNIMVSSQSTARDAESWSSTSPPHAPAPPPFVANLSSINPVNPLADMLRKQEEIQRKQEEIQRKQEEIQRKQEQVQREQEQRQHEEEEVKQEIEKYLSSRIFSRCSINQNMLNCLISDHSKNCFIDISINSEMCNERVYIKLFDKLAPMTCGKKKVLFYSSYFYNF
ncbi:unnamed protein product [Rotaria sp. Silwood2]|nr:unnamed protein product [Rotaria sp. Silwood2]